MLTDFGQRVDGGIDPPVAHARGRKVVPLLGADDPAGGVAQEPFRVRVELLARLQLAIDVDVGVPVNDHFHVRIVTLELLRRRGLRGLAVRVDARAAGLAERAADPDDVVVVGEKVRLIVRQDPRGAVSAVGVDQPPRVRVRPVPVVRRRSSAERRRGRGDHPGQQHGVREKGSHCLMRCGCRGEGSKIGAGA